MPDPLLIRCRSCTPASAVELTDWLEDKVARLRTGTPPVPVRLARLVQDLPMATVDDGWLIEIQPPDQPSDFLMATLEETVRDMRILGLDPTLLVPSRLLPGDSVAERPPAPRGRPSLRPYLRGRPKVR